MELNTLVLGIGIATATIIGFYYLMAWHDKHMRNQYGGDTSLRV